MLAIQLVSLISAIQVRVAVTVLICVFDDGILVRSVGQVAANVLCIEHLEAIDIREVVPDLLGFHVTHTCVYDVLIDNQPDGLGQEVRCDHL